MLVGIVTETATITRTGQITFTVVTEKNIHYNSIEVLGLGCHSMKEIF